MSDARFAALKALEKCRRDGAWSDAVIGGVIEKFSPDPRDRKLATAICYGVMQNMLLLDWHIDRHSSVKTARLEPKVLDILLVSAYQIIFLDRIPVSAAVNEGVSLCGKLGFRRASGLVNAVLRRIGEEKTGARLPQPTELSIKYSHPQWLCDYLIGMLGAEEAESLLKCQNSSAHAALQVNTLKTSADELSAQLEALGVETKPHDFLENCLVTADVGRALLTECFADGLFYVQDAAAKMAVAAAQPEKAKTILDVCSAPGGKSFAAAILSSDGAQITSCDIHENKLKRIHESAERLGISGIRTQVRDGREFAPEWEEKFDLVITDVPCSGLGVIRKKPDIRYKDPAEFEALPQIQLDILKNASRYVAPGGVLLYSTCTYRHEENADVVSAFLAENAGFKPENFTTAGGFEASGGMLTLMPQRHGTDGFFIAKLRRI